MRTRLLATVMVLICGWLVSASDVTTVQTDWSDGPGVSGSVTEWGERFSSAEDVAWRVSPGRLALATTAILSPERNVFPGEASGAIKIYATDIDLDGDTDVLGASYYDNELVLFVNDGSQPPLWSRQVIDAGFVEALAVAVADIDGDGLPDILGGSDAGAEVAWWRNLGGSPPIWSRNTVDDQVPGAHDVAGADLDGDEDLDIIGVSYENDEILWWRNDGGTPVAWQRQVIASDFDYPTKVSATDVDRDGDIDVYGVAWLGRQVAWWRNDGGDPISWVGEVIEDGFIGAHWVDAVDVNGDGWTDVIGAAMDLGDVVWWQNGGDGSSTWQKHIVFGSLSGAVSTSSGDLDGDGDLDIAAAGWSASGRLAWFENLDGEGTSWQFRNIDGSFDQSSSVSVADIDGNGALDVLGSSWDLNQFGWWRVGDFVEHGSLTSSILDTGGTLDWSDCGWNAFEPPSAILTVEGRTSNDPQAMGTWVPLASGPGCPGLLAGARYVQYRVLLDSASEAVSPTLEEISFTWLPRLSPAPRQSTGRVSP